MLQNKQALKMFLALAIALTLFPQNMIKVQAAAAPYWQTKYSNCFDRYYPSNGYVEQCYKISQLINDGDTKNDYWALQTWVVAKSNSGYNMVWINLSATSSASSPTMAWRDWAPTQNTNGNCREYQVSVAHIVGISKTFNRCETWNVSKSTYPGMMTMKWVGKVENSTRELSLAELVAVPQGKTPIWIISSSMCSMKKVLNPEYCEPNPHAYKIP